MRTKHTENCMVIFFKLLDFQRHLLTDFSLISSHVTRTRSSRCALLWLVAFRRAWTSGRAACVVRDPFCNQFQFAFRRGRARTHPKSRVSHVSERRVAADCSPKIHTPHSRARVLFQLGTRSAIVVPPCCGWCWWCWWPLRTSSLQNTLGYTLPAGPGATQTRICTRFVQATTHRSI